MTPIPLPFVRQRLREARGHLMSDATPASLRDTSQRFIDGLHPDVRRACIRDEAREVTAPEDAS